MGNGGKRSHDHLMRLLFYVFFFKKNLFRLLHVFHKFLKIFQKRMRGKTSLIETP